MRMLHRYLLVLLILIQTRSLSWFGLVESTFIGSCGRAPEYSNTLCGSAPILDLLLLAIVQQCRHDM